MIKLLDEEGADGIKMMATGGYMTTTTNPSESAYPREVFAAAVEEAHRRGRYITAHAHGVEGMRARVGGGHRLPPARLDDRAGPDVAVLRGGRARHGGARHAGGDDDGPGHARRSARRVDDIDWHKAQAGRPLTSRCGWPTRGAGRRRRGAGDRDRHVERRRHRPRRGDDPRDRGIRGDRLHAARGDPRRHRRSPRRTSRSRA